MLQITIQWKQKGKPKKSLGKYPEIDILVLKPVEKREKDSEGNIIIKRTLEKTNITRKINETAKLIKNDYARNNLEKIKQIFNS